MTILFPPSVPPAIILHAVRLCALHDHRITCSPACTRPDRRLVDLPNHPICTAWCYSFERSPASASPRRFDAGRRGVGRGGVRIEPHARQEQRLITKKDEGADHRGHPPMARVRCLSIATKQSVACRGLVRRGPLAEFHTVGKDGRRIDHLHS
jgi:hypothetical protein